MNGFRRFLKAFLVVTVVGLPLGQLMATDNEDSRKKSSETTKKSAGSERSTAFLGLLVEELPPAFASQLPNVVSSEQGILVLDVTPDSPAAKAGVSPHDILLAYDDQKLFAPEQLIKLVRADKPGRQVKLELVRAGKLEHVQVALGERREEVPAVQSPPQISRRFPWPFNRPPRRWGTGRPLSETEKPPNWMSFDSLTLKKLDEHRFHASIRHTDKEGKLQKHEFEGTREEIQQQIEADKDLTPGERTHLLRSLDLRSTEIPIWVTPEEGLFDF